MAASLVLWLAPSLVLWFAPSLAVLLALSSALLFVPLLFLLHHRNYKALKSVQVLGLLRLKVLSLLLPMILGCGFVNPTYLINPKQKGTSNH